MILIFKTVLKLNLLLSLEVCRIPYLYDTELDTIMWNRIGRSSCCFIIVLLFYFHLSWYLEHENYVSVNWFCLNLDIVLHINPQLIAETAKLEQIVTALSFSWYESFERFHAEVLLIRLYSRVTLAKSELLTT